LISKNELDAAKTVHYEELNVQDQPKMVWPPSFALSRAYLDQLARSGGLPPARITVVRDALDKAEKMSASARKDDLSKLATALHGEMSGSKDSAKVHLLALSIGDLAK
ncbi:MAG TPA: hypothetical protein VE967_03580, partial [Gemmatimonadaceae bacterium]|nr:hypothetical protein [Gemmatimonadaceae bacterium]